MFFEGKPNKIVRAVLFFFVVVLILLYGTTLTDLCENDFFEEFGATWNQRTADSDRE